MVIAIHDGETWKYKYRYDTKSNHPSLFYETGLRDLLLEWGIAPGKITQAAVSSVVPSVTEVIIEAIVANIRFEPLLLSPEVFLQLNMHIPKIYEIGSDLVANAFAAKKIYQRNTLVVDFGTALSFTVYNENNGIEGVTISPGLKTIISTLSGSTAQLPEIEIKVPESAIGQSTSTAIQAGVLFGFIGLVKEIILRIQNELPVPYYVVATGGLSTAIEELKSEFSRIDKELTLEGIRQIHLAVSNE
ncbi:MAG: type III pantothenate kinase [Bacteroidota bacterium]